MTNWDTTKKSSFVFSSNIIFNDDNYLQEIVHTYNDSHETLVMMACVNDVEDQLAVIQRKKDELNDKLINLANQEQSLLICLADFTEHLSALQDRDYGLESTLGIYIIRKHLKTLSESGLDLSKPACDPNHEGLDPEEKRTDNAPTEMAGNNQSITSMRGWFLKYRVDLMEKILLKIENFEISWYDFTLCTHQSFINANQNYYNVGPYPKLLASLSDPSISYKGTDINTDTLRHYEFYRLRAEKVSDIAVKLIKLAQDNGDHLIALYPQEFF